MNQLSMPGVVDKASDKRKRRAGPGIARVSFPLGLRSQASGYVMHKPDCTCNLGTVRPSVVFAQVEKEARILAQFNQGLLWKKKHQMQSEWSNDGWGRR